MVDILRSLQATILERKRTLPANSYTTQLFSHGVSLIKRKVGEEAIEIITAESKDEIICESADLLYHLLVYLVANDARLEDVCAELQRRAQKPS